MHDGQHRRSPRRPSSSPTTPRSCATGSDARSRAPAIAPSPVKSAAELLARVRADLDAASICIVLDLRLPHAPGVDLVRSDPQARRRPAADSGLQRHDRQRRRSARAGRARRRRLRQRVQRRAAHPAVARAAPVSRQLQPPRQPARRARHSRSPYRFGNTIAAALTLNLSRGGIAIRTTSPLETGAKRHASASACPARSATSTPRGASPGATAASAWACSSRGSSRPDQAAIDEFVDAHFFSNRKA